MLAKKWFFKSISFIYILEFYFMSNAETIIKKTQERFNKTLDVFKGTVSGISLKPNANFFNAIKVEAYGGHYPITNYSSVNIVDSKTLNVRVHDAQIAGSVYKAIQAANLGVTAILEGTTIKVIMPPMSTERRKSTSELVTKSAEESKVSLRNIRREENDIVKKMLKEKTISEDVAKKAEKKIQEMTDAVIKDIESISGAKVKEIMEF